MEPQTPPSLPAPDQQPSSEPAVAPQSQKPKRRLWIFITLALAAIVVGVVVFLLVQSSQKQNKPGGGPNQVQAFKVGAYPYIEACSVVTEDAFRAAFSLTGDAKVGTKLHEAALLPASSSSEADVTKLAPETGKNVTTSECNISLAPVAQTKQLTSISTRLMQYTDTQKAKTYLDGRRSFEALGGGPAAPALPSFPDSLLKLPSAQGASRTVVATTLHNNVNLELSYLMNDNETTDLVIPKLDNLTKMIIQNLDNAAMAAKSSNATGHVTQLDKAFVDTCFTINLPDLAKKVGDIEFNVIATRYDQYGALAGSTAAEDGVDSSCTLTYNTAQERQARQADSSGKKTTTTLTQKEKYPHTLIIETNKYPNTEEAARMLQARKAQNLRLSTPERPVSIQTVSDLGDGGYVLHKETEIPDFSAEGNNKRAIVEDSYVILKGSDLVTIDFQQSKSAKTMPLAIKDPLIHGAYALFETLLTK